MAIALIQFLHDKGLIKRVLDEENGVFLLQGTDRPEAVAYLKEQDVLQYLSQLSDDGLASTGTTPESSLEIWVLEETGVVGWSSKRFGIRRAKRSRRMEQFSESTSERTGFEDYEPGAYYWTSESD